MTESKLMIKKLLTLLFAAFIVAQSFTAFATVRIWGMTFTPSDACCETSCEDYSSTGQPKFSMVPNAEYIIDSGDGVVLATNPDCCSNTAKIVGTIATYYSTDGGSTWYLSGIIWVYQPGNSNETQWTFTQSQVDGSVASSRPTVLQSCTQGL